MNFLDFFIGKKTKKIALCALLTALSMCLAFASFPIFPSAPFLRMDFADTTLFLTGMICGPIYGLVATLISCVYQDLVIAHSPANSGMLIHFLITGITMLIISIIYRNYFKKNIIKKINDKTFKNNNKKSVIYTLIVFFSGAISWFSLATILNLTITPKVYGISTKEVIKSMLSVLILFNVIKYVINFMITFIIILRIHKKIIKNFAQNNNKS